MLKRIVPATLIASLAITAGAMAHETSFPSQVEIGDLECADCNGAGKRGVTGTHAWVLWGIVESPRAACIPDRTVKVFIEFQAPQKRGTVRQLVDIDRTSANGAWSGFFTANLDFAERAIARVTPKNLGSGDHRHICEGDSASLDLTAPA